MNDIKFDELVKRELLSARTKHGPQQSVHEGYAVLLEELDEVWDHIKAKSNERDYHELLKELVQVGSCAQKMAEDVVLPQLTTTNLSSTQIS